MLKHSTKTDEPGSDNMSTMNFSIPEDVKEAFNEAFKDENKSAVVTDLMRQAVERKRVTDRLAKRDTTFRERVLRRIAESKKTYSSGEIRKLRAEGRP